MSVFTATNSTCEMSASIIRLTALRPAPPTPTTRMTAMYAPGSGTRWRRGGGSGSGSRRARSGSRAGDGGSASGSGLRSGRRTGSGGGCGAASSIHSGTCSTVCSGGSTGLADGSGSSVRPSFLACRCAASVARNSSASGPSRMLARLRAIEHLLREVAVGRGGTPAGIVFQNRGSFHRRLRVADGLPDLRVEDEVAEVLLQDLDRFARVQRAGVEHRRQDPLDLDPRIEVLADHRKRVFELDQAAQREVLALHRDDHPTRRDERVDGQQTQRRRGVDQNVVVVVLDLDERLLESAFT